MPGVTCPIWSRKSLTGAGGSKAGAGSRRALGKIGLDAISRFVFGSGANLADGGGCRVSLSFGPSASKDDERILTCTA